jgi:hypothetical protein
MPPRRSIKTLLNPVMAALPRENIGMLSKSKIKCNINLHSLVLLRPY